MTPLMYAIKKYSNSRSNEAEVVDYLIDNSDLNVVNKYDWPALGYAYDREDWELVRKIAKNTSKDLVKYVLGRSSKPEAKEILADTIGSAIFEKLTMHIFDTSLRNKKTSVSVDAKMAEAGISDIKVVESSKTGTVLDIKYIETAGNDFVAALRSLAKSFGAKNELHDWATK